MATRREDPEIVTHEVTSGQAHDGYIEQDLKEPTGEYYGGDEKKQHEGGFTVGPETEIEAANVVDEHTGKEKVMRSAADITQRAISLEDDPTEPVWTFRVFFLGLGLTCFAAVLGQIFYFRPQTIYVSQLFLQIISYILGEFMAKVIPTRGFFRHLNPGPFNIKEHAAILIMSSTATSSALAISVYATDDLYYNIKPNGAVAIFTLLSSQLMGYGMAGLCRSFLVYPTFTVFPNLLPTVQLFDVLHRDTQAADQKKRQKFFWIVFLGIFVWEWIPEYIAPTLTGISVFCLANQNSAWFTRIFGGSNGNEGLGMFGLCFDWAYIGSGGGSLGALFTPISTQLSQYTGVLLCIIIACSCYATDAWHAQSFPFLSQELFFVNGTVYDQSLILNADYSLNQAAVDVVGLPWFAPTNAVYFLGSNLAIGATFMHVFLWYGPEIKAAIRSYRQGGHTDPHYLKMQAYKEAPMWWYGATLAISWAVAVGCGYAGNSQLPWWGFLVALIIACFAYPFVTAVYAVTGFNTDTQLLAQMLGAAIRPGNPQSNMYFVLYASNTIGQGYHLTRDLKMGQYVKLPPRMTFTAQFIGTVIGACLNYAIMQQIITNQREILLSVQGSNIWSGQQVQTFNSLAISWGALGGALYGPGAPYFIIPLCTVIGLAVPVPFYILHKFFPKLKANMVVTPVLCWCLGYLSVGINSSVFSTFLLGIFSQYYLRVHRPTWFRKYNYLASAALDGGTQIMVFIATFAVFGASGSPVAFPIWALNPDPELHNYDYCKRLT